MRVLPALGLCAQWALWESEAGWGLTGGGWHRDAE